MTNIAMLVVCLLVGMILRATRRVPENAHVAINAFIIHVALPALILGQIHGLHLTPELLLPVSMPWVLFALTVPVFAAARPRHATLCRRDRGADHHGGAREHVLRRVADDRDVLWRQGSSTGILIDQLGTYLVLSTLGITVACMYSSGTASWREVARRVATSRR